MFSVSMVSTPPPGMASRAFTARFTSTWSTWPGSAKTLHNASPRDVFRSMCSPIVRVLGLHPVRHVAHGRRDEQAVLGLECGEADVGRELGAVLAPGRQLHAGAHGPRPGLAEVPGPMGGVLGAGRIGDEKLDPLA